MGSSHKKLGQQDTSSGTGDTAGSEPQSPAGDGSLETLPGGGRQLGASSRGPRPGDRVGRFLILDRVGAGGMGVVYRARDTELEREVALKVVHPQHAGSSGSGGDRRARLLREAQTMAKLSHPNLIPVFDVGPFGDDIFMAMELVEGQDLREWLEVGPRPWRSVVAVFIQAAEGLHAAHAAGLVHRDFKPANVLVGDDDRVRVVDFGLARLGAQQREAQAPHPEPAADNGPTPDPLTVEGSIIGTPAYMAPEQFAEQPADHRSDQYSFSVSLWEAVYGTRPITAEGYPELSRRVLEGEVADPPAGRGAPLRLKRILLRGLQRQPPERYASMKALAHDLIKLAGRRRAWTIIGGTAIASAAAATGAAILAFGVVDNPGEQLCTGSEALLDGVWDATARDATRAAFSRSGRPSAEVNFRRTAELIDAYSGEWVAMRTQACRDTRLTKHQSEAALDLRMACLQRHLRSLRVFVDLLVDADVQVVDTAVDAAVRLPSLQACTDVERLSREQPLPADPAERDVVEALAQSLSEADALNRAGKYEAARAIADAVVAKAELTDYAPLRSRALLLQGELQDRLGQSTQALRTLQRAADAGAEARDPSNVARAHALMVFARSISLGEPQPALELYAAAKTTAVLAEDDAVLGQLENAAGAAAHTQGDSPTARDHFALAVKLRTRALGNDHPDVASSLNNLATVHRNMGDHNASRIALDRAEAIYKAVYHDEHPALALQYASRAVAASQAKNFVAAIELERKALEIRQRAFGDQHEQVGRALNNLASYHIQIGAPKQACDYAQRATAVFDAVLADDHPYSASSFNLLGECLNALGRHEEGLAAAERGLRVWIALPNRRQDLADARFNVATSLRGLGRDLERALKLAKQAHEAYAQLRRTKWSSEAAALAADLESALRSR